MDKQYESSHLNIVAITPSRNNNIGAYKYLRVHSI